MLLLSIDAAVVVVVVVMFGGNICCDGGPVKWFRDDGDGDDSKFDAALFETTRV